jgi:hypothetical protein
MKSVLEHDHVFIRGINVTPEYAKAYADKIIEVLKPTPIDWIRIHPFPTRRIGEPGYLESVTRFCEAGFNLIITVDVGTSGEEENRIVVQYDELKEFVEESYTFSYRAAGEIEPIVRKYGREIIYGVENEINPNAWISQSLPGIGWRKTPEAWFVLATDETLRYERLNRILQGITDVNKDALTMTNVLAEDASIFFPNLSNEFEAARKLLQKDLKASLEDWSLELRRVRDRLAVDLVGIDDYPNYFVKYPPAGQEIGSKVERAREAAGKPVINCEFGYTTYRAMWQKILYPLLGRPSSGLLQRKFFENALDSISKSNSKGTLPWVLLTEPYKPSNPPEENWFGLFKKDKTGSITPEPAYDLYKSWLASRSP